MKAILFDLWGTLCYNDMAAKRNEEITQIIGFENKELWDRLRTEYWHLNDIPSDKFFKRLLGETELKDDLVQLLVETWEKQLDSVHRYPETAEVLGDLKSKGISIGLISNTLPITNKMLDILDIRKFFDAVILSFEVGLLKPEKKIYKKALKKMKVKPEETLFVGNELVLDFVIPRKLGMKSLLLDRNGIIPHSVKDLWGVVEVYNKL